MEEADSRALLELSACTAAGCHAATPSACTVDDLAEEAAALREATHINTQKEF